MSFEVRIRAAARKELDALSDKNYQRVNKTLLGLEQNPRPAKVKKLAGSGLWRVRTGYYRVVYAIDDAARVVIIVRIARRSEDTYKGL